MSLFKKSGLLFNKLLNISSQRYINTEKCDIFIIGGGIMGSTSAYWLKKRNPNKNITVIEMDPEYKKASTVLSMGGIRTQFSLPENIKLSQFSFSFLQNASSYLNIDTSNLSLKSNGYLMLASKKDEEIFKKNYETQKSCNAKVRLLLPEEIIQLYPWLNIENIILGCIGQDEGWFDPYTLLIGFKYTNKSLGVNYVDGELIDFNIRNVNNKDEVNSACVKSKKGEITEWSFENALICTGAQSGKVSQLLRIGTDTGDIRSIECPIYPRKRYLFVFKCPKIRGDKFPMVVDFTGVHFRPEGDNFIVGLTPPEEPSIDDLDVDHEFFDNCIWPILAHRVPHFAEIKVVSAWAGYYEYNILDSNGIIGPHPYYQNIFWASGFSGHGIQMAIGVGKVISELITDGVSKTINVSRFGWDRIINNQPLREICVI